MSRESIEEIQESQKDESDEAFANRQAQIKKEREAEQGKTDEALESEADKWLREAGFDPKKVG